MANFDRFKPPTPLDPAPKAPDRNWRDRASAYHQLGKTSPTPEGLPPRGLSKANFAILLDATGSMASLIDNAKASIGEIIARVRAEAGIPIKLQIIAFRDNDVKEVIETSPLSDDPRLLEHWLMRLRTFGGGSNPGEAIEDALAVVAERQHFHAVLLAGDEPPNPASDLSARGMVQKIVAVEWASRLGKANVPIHAFVIGSRRDTLTAFSQLARLSGGRQGRLDGGPEMIDLAVMALLSRIRGAEGVRSYAAKQRLSANAENFKTLLLGSRN